VPPTGAAERGQQLEFGVDMAKRGLWSEALFRFRRADAEDPENPRILNNLAVSYEAVGQFDEAMELYKRAVKLDPANAELKRNYARFVEFYQGFRPRETEAEDGAAEETGESQDTEAAEGGDSEADEEG
jgi:Tfp pilus assembly protein PilF